MNLESNMG